MLFDLLFFQFFFQSQGFGVWGLGFGVWSYWNCYKLNNSFKRK